VSARVTMVVVTFNSRDTVDSTLESHRERCVRGEIRCIVVDNASLDGTADHIERAHPWVSVVRSRENEGFGRACNRGLTAADTEYVLLLNPDAVLLPADLDLLLEFMDQTPRAGVCGPAVQEASGVLQHAGGLPSPWRIMLKPLIPRWSSRGQYRAAPGDKPVITDWICGSTLLVRKRLIDEIGGFDPRFFLYFEETDLCRRALASGWEIWTDGRAVGTHASGASAKTTASHMMWGVLTEHYFRSRYYYLVKHFGWLSATAAELGELVAMFLRAVLDGLRGRRFHDLRPRLRSPILRLPASRRTGGTPGGRG
jgi:N-acetylglucosaminyl-diphospho-decaprenol L-rhamnosyltransferase